MGTGGDVARGAGELGLQGLLVDVLHHAAAIEAATFISCHRSGTVPMSEKA